MPQMLIQGKTDSLIEWVDHQGWSGGFANAEMTFLCRQSSGGDRSKCSWKCRRQALFFYKI